MAFHFSASGGINMVFYERAALQPGSAVNDRGGTGQGLYCYLVNNENSAFIDAEAFTASPIG
jgi:hypothetical protein